MSKSLISVLAFAVVLSIASCRVVRDAPNKADISLSNAYDDVTNLLKNFENDLLKYFGAKDTQDLQKKAEETGREIASKLDTWAEEIKKDTADLKNNPAIKSLQETVAKTIEDVKAKHPQTAEEITKFAEELSKGTENVVQKIKDLGESEDANKLKDLSKKLLETASNTVQNIAQEVKENLNKQ